MLEIPGPTLSVGAALTHRNDGLGALADRVSPNGTITTVAGTGARGFSGDGGQATLAMLSSPFGVAPTADGGFLVVAKGNQRIRKVAVDETITTVAGNGVAGYSGDGAAATTASLFDPNNVTALDDRRLPHR